ncbi:MAG: type 1 glutamine amidotransferase [Sedimentisphaerales bacterium]|nr:type 1 glutamine amidotransferase [Sedimentisphaerales bacterium]
MRVHYLQHVPFEDSANIGNWAKANEHSLTKTEIYKGQPYPDISDIDMLAIMGGPMNIFQYRDYPWLKNEKVFIEKAIEKGIKVIGICLGAQLIADVLGARVTQNPYVEIGWHEVTLTKAGTSSNILQDFTKTFTAFHWHGDTFEIPKEAIHLAFSEACTNQAFQYKENVIGLQFHLEYSQESIEKMLDNCSDELIDAPYVQNKEHIRKNYHLIKSNIELLNTFFKYFL